MSQYQHRARIVLGSETNEKNKAASILASGEADSARFSFAAFRSAERLADKAAASISQLSSSAASLIHNI